MVVVVYPVVTVSPKFQVVLPKQVRDDLNIKVGEKMVVLEKGRQIVLVPLLPIKKLRGSMPGLTLEGLRDESIERD